MTDIQTLRDDVAFLKALALDEGPLPRAVGAQLFAAGLIFGVPLIPVWASLRGFVHWIPEDQTGWVSIWSTIVYVPVAILLAFIFRAPKVESPRALAALAGWSGIGLTTLSILAVIFIAGARLHEPKMWQVWTCVCFSLYGAAWWVAAILRPRKGWLLVALGSYLTAVANAFFVSTWDVLLVCGLGLIVWISGPGLVIVMRPRATA